MIGVSFCCSTGYSRKYITFQIAAFFIVLGSVVLWEGTFLVMPGSQAGRDFNGVIVPGRLEQWSKEPAKERINLRAYLLPTLLPAPINLAIPFNFPSIIAKSLLWHDSILRPALSSTPMRQLQKKQQEPIFRSVPFLFLSPHNRSMIKTRHIHPIRSFLSIPNTDPGRETMKVTYCLPYLIFTLLAQKHEKPCR